MDENIRKIDLSVSEEFMIMGLCSDVPEDYDKLGLFRAGFMAGKYAEKLRDIFLHLPNSQIQVDIFQMILEERTRQDIKFGADRDQDHMFWLAILAEEFGEAANAILEKKGSSELTNEIIQCAAVSVAWVENIRRRTIIQEQNKVNESLKGKSVIPSVVEELPMPEVQ